MNTAEELFDEARENDPEEQKREAQKVLAGNQPLMEQPTDPWLTLPRGLRVGDRWDTQAMVRELTGVDEENLNRYRKDRALLLDAVLAFGVESIGPNRLTDQTFDQRTSLLRQLLIGEREQLFLAVARATFGNEKELTYVCTTCGEDNDITISLEDHIVLPTMEDPHQETYTFTTTGGEVISYRPVTGTDQFDINARSKGLSDAEQNTLLFSEIIDTVDGRPVVDKRAVVRNLGMRDRAKFLKEILERQVSPKMDFNTECSMCEASTELPLTLELVFRP